MKDTAKIKVLLKNLEVAKRDRSNKAALAHNALEAAGQAERKVIEIMEKLESAYKE